MTKTRTLYKSGGSTVVSMPTSILEAVELEEGDDVLVEAGGDKIEIFPVEYTKAHRAGGDA